MSVDVGEGDVVIDGDALPVRDKDLLDDIDDAKDDDDDTLAFDDATAL